MILKLFQSLVVASTLLFSAAPMVFTAMSTDNGGTKLAIDAYSDGGGVLLINQASDTKFDNSSMNKLVFKYGDAAKSANTTIKNQVNVLSPGATTLEKAAASTTLEVAKIAVNPPVNGTACDDGNNKTINDNFFGGVCVGTIDPLAVGDLVDPFKDGSGVILYTFDDHANNTGAGFNGVAQSHSYVPGVIGKAISLMGSTAKVTIPNRTLGSNFTISAKVQVQGTGFGSILLANNQGWWGNGLEFLASPTSTSAQWPIPNGQSPGGVSGTYAAGTWSTVTLTRAGSNFVMYINGVQVGTYVSSSTAQNLASPIIGNYTNNSANYGSSLFIDQFRIFNRAVTPAEAQILASER